MALASECEYPDTTTVLQRLCTVLTDPDCALQEQRQLVLLETFFNVAEERIKLKDLRLLTKVMDVIASKAVLESKYQQHLQNILDLLKAPIRMEKSSDQVEYHSYLVEFFTSIGYILLQTENNTVKFQVLKLVVRTLLTKRVGDSDMVPVNACVRALELSELTECLADFIAIAENELFGLTIFIVLQISHLSKLCCWTLLLKEVLESILVRLTLCLNEDVEGDMYNLLWSLLNCTDRPEDWEKIPQPSRIALRSLRYVLREKALTHCHPGNDRDALCNIAALTLKIIHLFPQADFVLSGLTEDITVSATLSESVLEIHIIPFFKSKSEHLHFKKLMLACLAAMPISSHSLEIFERYKLAECLVSMLRLDSSRPRISWLSYSVLSLGSDKSSATFSSDLLLYNFNQEQNLDLFRVAISVVGALFDDLYQRFMKAGIIKTLTYFLLNYYIEERNRIDDLFNTVIKIVFFMCFHKKNPKQVRKELTQAGAATALLDSCVIILKPDSALTIKIQSILCHILQILSAIMEKQTDLQAYHADTSLNIVKSLYHRVINPLAADSIIDNRLIVSISNFAWSALISHETNLLKFLDSGELYSHLDILQKGDLPAQLVYLSTLVDAAEHHKSVPYLVSWRGPKGIKLLSVLCGIWRKEESRLKVPRNKDGCIIDLERPLMGEDQYQLSKEDKSNYVSVSDVLGSCRPKIYAIVQLLHRHGEVTNLCEEHYRLGYDVLPWEDQTTMQLIESYLPLKVGEVWWEIFNKQEKVLPLDRYLAQTLALRYLDWSQKVQEAQHAVLKQRRDTLQQEENQFYSQVRSVQLTAALEALRQVTAIARTTDRQLLLSAHRRFREDIEASRPATAADLDLHVAFPRDVRILVVNPAADVVLQNEQF